MIVYLERDIPAFVMYCVNGESVMIIDYHSNKSIIGIYNIIDYDNRLIVPALNFYWGMCAVVTSHAPF